MLYQSLACGVLLGSLALEVAATPIINIEQIPDFPPVHSNYRRIPSTHTIHERQLPHWAHTWRRVDSLPGHAVLPMRIGLRWRNEQQGHDRLMAMSDPKSSSFGQHMTSAEVTDFFAPERGTVEAVVAWLTESGIDVDRISQSTNKQWLQFDAKASEVEELLLTKYYVFEHEESGTEDVAAENYYLPHEIREHIDYITPGIRLRYDSQKLEQKRKRSDKRSVSPLFINSAPLFAHDATASPAAAMQSNLNCTMYLTPDCIKTQYGIPNATKASEGNELGIFESLGQYYSKDDLDQYFQAVYPAVPKGTYPIERLINGARGAVDAREAGSEAMLDLESTIPLIYPQSTVFFGVDDDRIQKNETKASTPYRGFFNTFFDAIDGSYCTSTAFGQTGNCVKPECLDPVYPDPLPGGYNGTLQCGVFRPTNVISISYGGGEIDVPSYYWKRQCLEIMKLSLQGVTVVISSGDYGVGSYPGDNGAVNGCLGTNHNVFNPASQATCPYVLSVGSTSLHSPHGRSNESLVETASTRFSSGGGFSNYFCRPWYQADAVDQYLSSVELNFTSYDKGLRDQYDVANVTSGVFHRYGRGYPDVAAVGERYVTRLKGQWNVIGGTSLSAPIWASILNLINEERLAVGKKPIGFVNQILYDHPEVFTDIVDGGNPNCGTTGFLAAKGWDPVTGLGTPKYDELLKLLLSQP